MKERGIDTFRAVPLFLRMSSIRKERGVKEKMKRQGILTFAVMAVFLACGDLNTVQATEAQSTPVQMEEYELPWMSLHMGTIISGKVYGSSEEEVLKLRQMVEDEIVRYEDMMSVHKKTALNEVNDRSGEWVSVPQEVAEMTREALEVAKDSNQAFEPTIGPVVNLWKIGFGGDTVPSDEAIQKAVQAVDYRKVEVRETSDGWQIRVAPGQNLDMGGIAKGYIGQKLVELLRAYGAKHALLDLGGNVVTLGEKSVGRPWRVGLQRPDQKRNTYFAVVSAKDVSVITSGAYERYFEKEGMRYGHILDPRTGRPALTDISSVTIMDEDGAKADAWCTALFAMGWDRALQTLRDREDIMAVVLNSDLKNAWVSEGLVGKVKFTDQSIKIHRGN